METWFHASQCKHIPSSFVFQSTRHHHYVTVVGNGSKFVYFLDTKKKHQLGVLKFAIPVVHVSLLGYQSLLGPERQSQTDIEPDHSAASGRNQCGVCCLEDGRIVSINLEEALEAFNETQGDHSHTRSDDVFSSLLGTSSRAVSRKKGDAIQGENFSVPIAACGDPHKWSLLSALVFNEKLIVCKKSKASEDTHLTIQTSMSRVKRDSITIPTFHGAPCTQCVLSTSKLISQPGIRPQAVSLKRLRYRPVMEIIEREDKSSSLRRTDVISLDSKLFLQLFGPEVELSNSPVLMVGCENGHVSFCGLNMVGGDGELMMTPLYSLEQPVVALHASFFPRKSVVDDFLMEDEDDVRPKKVSGVPNALLLVSRRGKIAVCFIGEQDCVKFVEFYCPSPILSTVLVPHRCIVYSTLCGMHRICLRQDCVDDISLLSSECRPLLFPEMSFKFPERMLPIVTNAVLLRTVYDSNTTDEEPMETETSSDHSNATPVSTFQVTVMFLTGCVGSLTVDDGIKKVDFQDEYSADQELQKHLKSIEVTSERANIMNERIATLNARLAELNVVLTLLCDMLMGHDGETSATVVESKPFCCKFSTSFEDIGVSKWKPMIDVELSYNSLPDRKPLGKGWSLLIQTCNEATPELSSRMISSKVISLVGLVPSHSVKSRMSVEVERDKPLLYSLNCILLYNASELCAGVMDATGSSKSTSILLLSKVFDALDFVQPFMQVPKELDYPLLQLFKLTQSQTEEKRDHHNQQYTLELPFFMSSSEQVQQPDGGDTSGECGRILNSLLPSHLTVGVKKDSISLTSYDGSSLTLAVVPRCSQSSTNAAGTSGSDSRCLKVFIKSSLKTMLLEVADCVQRRLKRNPSVEESSVTHQRMSRDEKFSRLAKLKQINQEVNVIFGEVGKFDKEVYRDSKSRQMKLVELESRTFKLLCQLKELP